MCLVETRFLSLLLSHVEQRVYTYYALYEVLGSSLLKPVTLTLVTRSKWRRVAAACD